MIKHGHSSGGKKTPEFAAYLDVKHRCTNPHNARWGDYGGRGIQFEFASFEQFYAALGSRPSKHHVLDRIENDSNYNSSNCRWITRSISQINQRKRRGTTSRFRGVFRDRRRWKWAATITSNYKNKFLGYFTSEAEAARAYDQAAVILHGEHAILNFPQKQEAA